MIRFHNHIKEYYCGVGMFLDQGFGLFSGVGTDEVQATLLKIETLHCHPGDRMNLLFVIDDQQLPSLALSHGNCNCFFREDKIVSIHILAGHDMLSPLPVRSEHGHQRLTDGLTRGKRTRNVAPWPGLLSHSIRPPRVWVTRLY